MVTGRKVGKLLLAVFAIAAACGCLICFFEHDKGEKATAMGTLAIAFVLAMRQFDY